MRFQVIQNVLPLSNANKLFVFLSNSTKTNLNLFVFNVKAFLLKVKEILEVNKAKHKYKKAKYQNSSHLNI